MRNLLAVRIEIGRSGATQQWRLIAVDVEDRSLRVIRSVELVGEHRRRVGREDLQPAQRVVGFVHWLRVLAFRGRKMK